jgi:hypothetical protein
MHPNIPISKSMFFKVDIWVKKYQSIRSTDYTHFMCMCMYLVRKCSSIVNAELYNFRYTCAYK